MSNPWFRMYHEFATDPKVQRLSETDQRRYIMLLCMRCCNGDVTLQDEDVTFTLRISAEEWASTKRILQDRNLIDSDNLPMAWDKRQYKSDSSAERVARHREQKKHDVTLQKRSSNAIEQNRTDIEQIQNRTEQKPPQAAFVLPDWVDRDQWELWLKTRKGKKMIPAQMEAQIQKLAKWRSQGLDYNKALADSASAGWQGLFEPKENISRSNAVQDARLDTARQIMGCKNGNHGQIIDVTPTRSDSSNGASIPETIDGLRKSTVG